MDSHIQLTENSQENAAPDEQTHQLAVAPVAVPPFATASLSHFTAVQHATHSFRQHRSSSLFASLRPTQAASGRVPTQASSLAHLSLSASASTASPARISCGSTISASPLQSPLTLHPHRALDPRCARLLPSPRWPMSFSLDFSATLSLSIIPPKISFDCNVSGNADRGPFGPSDRSTSGPDPSLDPPTRTAGPSRRASIVWFHRDLRVHDNESLNAAHDESMSVLHVYCFDPRCCRKFSSIFLVSIFQSVSDLRHRLRDRGSDLVVRVGHPEKVLPEMARAVGAEAVYAHRDVWPWPNEKLEEWVEAAMKEEGMEVKYFLGNTLFHIDDLPFKLEDMPMYPIFKERVQGVEVRKPIAVLDQLKGLPKRGDVEPGEMPSLKDLGVTPSASMAQDVEAPPEVGGESGALQWLKKFAAQYQAQQNEGLHIDKIDVGKSIHEIWPFMIRGCLSRRVLFEELKGNDDGGSFSTVPNWFMDWLVELDFLRFNYLKRYVSPVKQGALAGTGALV